MGVLQDKLQHHSFFRNLSPLHSFFRNLSPLHSFFRNLSPLFTVMAVFVVVSHSSFLSLEGFVNGSEGMEDIDPVEQNLRQAIEEEKAK